MPGRRASVGRPAWAVWPPRSSCPRSCWIQQTYGLTTVFVCLATLLIIAAVSVTQLGPESKLKGLDEVAPPTRRVIEADNAFWLTLAGGVCILLSFAWFLYFYLAAKQISSTAGVPALHE